MQYYIGLFMKAIFQAFEFSGMSPKRLQKIAGIATGSIKGHKNEKKASLKKLTFFVLQKEIPAMKILFEHSTKRSFLFVPSDLFF